MQSYLLQLESLYNLHEGDKEKPPLLKALFDYGKELGKTRSKQKKENQFIDFRLITTREEKPFFLSVSTKRPRLCGRGDARA